MSRILVTGGAGFIGSHVVDALVIAGHEVMVIDDLSSGKLDNLSVDIQSSIVLLRLGINQPAATEYRAKDLAPEIIIHLAAQPSLLESEKNPVQDAWINILGTLRLIQFAKDVGAKRFVFASTSAAQINPKSPYGISKRAAEQYLRILGAENVILRLGNVFGPRQVPLGENQLIPRALDYLYKTTFFEVHNKGLSARDFIYVEDVVNAFVMAATSEVHAIGPYDICTGISSTVKTVLDKLNMITMIDKAWPLATSVKPERPIVSMANDQFKNDYGWQPQYTLEEGLKETVEWYKSQL